MQTKTLGSRTCLDFAGRRTNNCLNTKSGGKMKKLATVITLVCTSAYGLTVQDLNVPWQGAAALALNNRGQVVGTFPPDFGFLWENGTVTPLGDIIPYAINDDGIMAGGSWQLRPLIKN